MHFWLNLQVMGGVPTTRRVVKRRRERRRRRRRRFVHLFIRSINYTQFINDKVIMPLISIYRERRRRERKEVAEDGDGAVAEDMAEGEEEVRVAMADTVR